MSPAGYGVLFVCGPLAALAAVWIAERIRVPYAILLVAVGVLLQLLPWIPVPQPSPNLVFYGFLPALVYYAALFVAPDDLRTNARSIGFLAVGLVIATTGAVAGVLMGVAGVPLAVALVAGAVVAPTDTMAATSVFKRLDVPERLETIVEGEGLTNDGTALVLYTGAVSTVAAGVARPGHLAMTLVAAPAGGAALGLAIAWILVTIRRRLDQTVLEIAISLATPYVAYALAEAAHLSGVLATVAAGVYTGSRLSAVYAPGARLQAFAFVDMLVFLLNTVQFTVLGMQLARVVHSVPGMPAAKTAAAIAAVVVVVIAMRLLWMLAGPATAKLLGRAIGPAVWQERMVVGWAGMRAGLSLAAALSIPLRRADGSAFPYRDLVIWVTATVIVVSLLVQGTTLPWLLRRLGIEAEDFVREENEARLQAACAALAWLNDHADAEGLNDAAESVRQFYEARVRRLQVVLPSCQGPGDAAQVEHYRVLRRKLVEVERSVVLQLRHEGRINATLLRTIERDLDLDEARLRGS